MCPLLGTSPVPTGVQLFSAPPAHSSAYMGTAEISEFYHISNAGVSGEIQGGGRSPLLAIAEGFTKGNPIGGVPLCLPFGDFPAVRKVTRRRHRFHRIYI